MTAILMSEDLRRGTSVWGVIDGFVLEPTKLGRKDAYISPYRDVDLRVRHNFPGLLEYLRLRRPGDFGPLDEEMWGTHVLVVFGEETCLNVPAKLFHFDTPKPAE